MLFMFYLLLFLLTPFVWTQQHDMPGMKMDVPAAVEEPAQADPAASGQTREAFNHHLAGLFLFAREYFILAESHLARRWPLVRFAWPMCFLCGRPLCSGL